MFDKAINNYKSALEYFSKSQDNYKRMISLYNKTGNGFLLLYMKNETMRNKATIDSVMRYHDKALLLTKTVQDSAMVIQNTGTMYIRLNKFGKAKQQLFQALKLNSDSILQNTIYLNLSVIYEAANMIDSAIYFAKLSENFLNKQKDNNYLITTYKILSKLEKTSGNDSEALEYNEKYMKCYDLMMKDLLDIHVLDLKYELDILREKDSVKHRFYIAFIICSWLVFTTVMFLCIKHIRKKNSESTNNTQESSEVKNILEEVPFERDENKKLVNLYHNTLKKYHKDIERLASNSSFNEILNQDNKNLNEIITYLESLSVPSDHKYKFTIHNLKKIAANNEKKCTSIVKYLQSLFSKSDSWEFIYDVNKLVFDEIKELYPKLTEQEYKILCLEYLDHTNSMIASVMNLSSNTIAQIKSNIRTKCETGERTNITKFIVKKIGKRKEE
jgi:tetratricopeptide (TPR) repeat protein